MENILQEALSALDGRITTAPSKIPEGATVVGIQLDRDPARSGRFVTSIDQHWLTTGMAVAITNGHVVSANYVFGRFTNGVPKVTACHYVTCGKCGNRVLMPLAVWEAKDNARKSGIEIPKEMAGATVLREHGRCTCGGVWAIDDKREKADLAEFAEKVLDAIAASEGPVPAFLGPKAFTVTPLSGEPKPLAKEWTWLTAALAKNGKAVAEFDQNVRGGDAILFNPGFWLGYTTDHHASGLFWVENGSQKRGAKPHFNPAGIDGL